MTRPCWTQYCENYLVLAHAVDRSVRLVTKTGWFWKALAWVRCILSLGIARPSRYLEEEPSVIGPIQAYPENWTEVPAVTIVRQSRITRQCRWFGLGTHPWMGFLQREILYWLFPVPVLFAWARCRLELDADRESWKYLLANGARAGMILNRAKRAGAFVASVACGFAWPKPLCVRGFVKSAER